MTPHTRRTGLALILLALLDPIAAPAQTSNGEHWIATWGTAQQLARIPPPAAGRGAGAPAAPAANAQPAPAAPAPPAQPPAPVQSVAAGNAGRGAPQRRFGIPPALPGLNNQTIRMIARVSTGGRTVRVRLTHALGATALPLGAAHLALRSTGSGIVPGSDRVLTFSRKPTATLYAGQVLVSDPVTMNLAALADVVVSLYFPGETGAPTSHTFGLRPTYVSTTGDFTGAAEIADVAATMQSYYWLAGVDVLAPADAGTIVTFGDSITDGDQSTPDSNRMWPSVLAARLQANRSTARLGIVNAGISGNRILGDNNGGLARLTSHALSVPGVKWITLLEGINDITGATRASATGTPAPAFSAETLIAAYGQVIELAHLYGVKVIGCTITPYGGSGPFTDQGEAIRQAVNTWVRSSGAFDAVVDFDAATRDPQDPQRFRPEADSPDMLHPGDAGYTLMADAFELGMFTRRSVPAGRKK
ncbi:MAG: SGNH/GDSL hydrolase family protein [Acidobacteriota bacterium]